MARRALLLVFAVIAICGASRAARACACVDWPPERRMAEADVIFIGRTDARPREDAAERVHFSVIEVLKGAPARELAIARHPDDDCDRSFQRGELALVFEVKGRMPVCAGNVDLDALMPTLGDYLGGDTAKARPDLDALKLALQGKVRGAKATVYAPALAGTTLQVGSTKVAFVDKPADDRLTAGGVTRGSLTYVALRAPDSVATYFLVGREHGKLAVLQQLRKDLKIR